MNKDIPRFDHTALADYLSSFLVIGHRGAAGLVPENTLPSFRKALDLGCRAIELDVHAVRDAEDTTQLMVIHDDTVQRTTNGKGLVSDHTFEQLTKLDAGDGNPIPRLAEVTALVAQHLAAAQPLVNIELKGRGTAAPTARFLQAHPELAVLVSSFNHRELEAFRALDETTPIAPLFERARASMLDTASALGASCVNVSQRMVKPGLIEQCNDAGFLVLAYTVNLQHEAQRLKALGVGGVFTDRPDVLMALGGD
ncbi:glycerophosphodiester phosphodiesterase family protein [Gammaproteobacteria bacterium]|nr:glycerophosphodiester phosphodiesterase family protein [Gammaproteobacteria bacterium]